MPFTFSHPAIVLPLTCLPKRWYSLTGLIVGSIAPDFEYFFRMNIQSIYSHTLWGILYFDLPIGLLLSFVYHSIVRDILVDNSPSIVSNHLTQYKSFNWAKHFSQNWLIVILSIIIGAGSHIFWDGFTHGNGFWVGVFPFLKHTVLQTASIRLPLYTVVQHVSTLVGGIYIYFFIKGLPIGEHNTKIDTRYWWYISLLSIVMAALICFLKWNHIHLGDMIVIVVASVLLSILLVSISMGRKKQYI